MKRSERWVRRGKEIAQNPKAIWIFGGISALESAFLPIPIDVVLFPVALAHRVHLWWVVLSGAVGSLVGAVLGYLIGYFAYNTIGIWLLTILGLSGQSEVFQDLLSSYGWWALVIAGLTPLPFKVAAILSGVAALSFFPFLIVVFCVRYVRFAFGAVLVLLFGDLLDRWLTKNPKGFAIGMLLLMLFGFAVLPFFV